MQRLRIARTGPSTLYRCAQTDRVRRTDNVISSSTANGNDKGHEMSTKLKRALRTIGASAAGGLLVGVAMFFFTSTMNAPAQSVSRLTSRVVAIELSDKTQNRQEQTDREDIGSIKTDIASIKKAQSDATEERRAILGAVMEVNRYLRTH